MSSDKPYGVGPTLIEMPFGSHLYGTQTPTSDIDIKGIFIPTLDAILTGRSPRFDSKPAKKDEGVKNEPGTVERQLMSIFEFTRLAIEGQTVALDMLHANPMMWVPQEAEYQSGKTILSNLWDYLFYQNRKSFHTKNLGAFVGYARRQASKYGVKGSRLACGKVWVELLKFWRGETVHWLLGQLPTKEDAPDLWAHASLTGDEYAPLEVLGKRLTAGATCAHYVYTFEHYVKSYGERAKLAETNEGVDWKAMSHAIRAAIQCELIFTEGDFSLPFDPETARHLRLVKQGHYPFALVREELESRIERLDVLAAASTLPDAVNTDDIWALVAAVVAEVHGIPPPKDFFKGA